MGQRRCSHNYHCSRDQTCVNGFCRKRECYYHSQCKQGYQCVNGECKAVPGYCTSHSSCTASHVQCCSKYHAQQVGGLCRNLKKPGEWCPMKVQYNMRTYFPFVLCTHFYDYLLFQGREERRGGEGRAGGEEGYYWTEVFIMINSK